MRGLLDKLMCWMGFHEWLDQDTFQVCKNCGEVEEYD